MNITIKNYQEPKFLQEGGTMDAPAAPVEEAPVEQAPEGGDPTQQILQVAAQALQNQDCEAAMAVCQALIQMVQGGAPQEAPAGQEPVYRKGGRLSYWKNK